jgi:hypothetical protein
LPDLTFGTPDEVLGTHKDEEQAIAVRELDATADLASQRDQLMSSAAFSASSRLVDLNGEASSLRKKHSSAIVVA